MQIGIRIGMSSGGRATSSPPVGSHQLTVGEGSGRGYFAGVLGDLQPPDALGITVENLQANAAGTVFLGFVGGVQVEDKNTVYVKVTGAPIALVWNADFGDYRASGRTDIWTKLGENIGQTIPVDIYALW